MISFYSCVIFIKIKKYKIKQRFLLKAICFEFRVKIKNASGFVIFHNLQEKILVMNSVVFSLLIQL